MVHDGIGKGSAYAQQGRCGAIRGIRMDDITWFHKFVEDQGLAVALVAWGVLFFSFRVWPSVEAGGRAVGPIVDRIATALENGVKQVEKLVEVQSWRESRSPSPPGSRSQD